MSKKNLKKRRKHDSLKRSLIEFQKCSYDVYLASENNARSLVDNLVLVTLIPRNEELAWLCEIGRSKVFTLYWFNVMSVLPSESLFH